MNYGYIIIIGIMIFILIIQLTRLAKEKGYREYSSYENEYEEPDRWVEIDIDLSRADVSLIKGQQGIYRSAAGELFRDFGHSRLKVKLYEPIDKQPGKYNVQLSDGTRFIGYLCASGTEIIEY